MNDILLVHGRTPSFSLLNWAILIGCLNYSACRGETGRPILRENCLILPIQVRTATLTAGAYHCPHSLTISVCLVRSSVDKRQPIPVLPITAPMGQGVPSAKTPTNAEPMIPLP